MPGPSGVASLGSQDSGIADSPVRSSSLPAGVLAPNTGKIEISPEI